MTELKTLKDLKWRSPEVRERIELGILPNDYVPINDWFVNEGKLKQEAIKWVKYYYEEREKAFDHDRWKWINQGRISELMDFFNITEEELK